MLWACGTSLGDPCTPCMPWNCLPELGRVWVDLWAWRVPLTTQEQDSHADESPFQGMGRVP